MKMKQTAVLLALTALLSVGAGLGIHTLTHWDQCVEATPVATWGPTTLVERNRNKPDLVAGLVFVQDAPPDVGDVLKEGQSVYTTWKELGVLAGLIALVTFLIRLTKLGFVGAAIKRNKAEWVRPLLAMVAAGLLASGGALALGQGLPWVILAGVLGGLAAPGAHEFLEAMTALFSKEKREELQAKSAP